MNPVAARIGLLVVNVALILGVVLLGIRTIRGGEAPKDEQLPSTFDPTRYDVRDDSVPESSLDSYTVVWQQVDRPERPPPPTQRPDPTPQPQPTPQPATPQDLSARYDLVMASFDPESPELSSAIIQDRRGGSQRTLGIDDDFDGYTIKRIVVRGDGNDREAIVTVDYRGQEQEIRLRRQ